MDLGTIVQRAVNSRLGRILLASVVAATMYACDGKATPTINPGPINTPSPTRTYTPEPSPTYTQTPKNTATPTEVPATAEPTATSVPATATPAIIYPVSA